MFPQSFKALTFYQKKQDLILLRATDESVSYMLKCAKKENRNAVIALRDEYEVLSRADLSRIPRYYGLNDSFRLPPHLAGGSQNVFCCALCMEYCKGRSLSDLTDELTLTRLVRIVLHTGSILLDLLDHGVLYTDLHPSNILVHEEDDAVTLLDFTYCYYFLRDPNPPYHLRFSYQLDPGLKGQQLLIQELAFLLQDVLEKAGDQESFRNLPSSFYAVLETGLNPSGHLPAARFLSLLRQSLP